jgi:hypothetical protein
MNIALIVVAGNSTILLDKAKQVFPTSTIEVIKADDKTVARFGYVKNLFSDRDAIVIGTANLDFQRFQTFWKIHFLLHRKPSSVLLDELGRVHHFSYLNFLKDIFFLALELTASTAVVLWASIAFPSMEKSIKHKTVQTSHSLI